MISVAELHQQIHAIERKQARLRQPAGRLFAELDLWLRMHLYQQRSGLPKQTVALIFLSRDVARLTDSFADVTASFLKLRAMGQLAEATPAPRGRRKGKGRRR